MAVYKRGERYWCDFHYQGRRYNEATGVTRRTLAIDYEKRRRRELEEMHAKGPQAAPKASRWLQTVSAAMKRYQDGYKANHEPKSVAWVAERAAHVTKALGAVTLMDLTEDRILAYIGARRAEGASNRTVNMELECLSRAAGRTWRELWPKVKRLAEREDIGRALAPEQEAAILTAAAANKSPLIDRFIRIALTSAMRAGEIRGLQVGRVDFRERTVQVGRAKTRKGTGRVIPMNEDLGELLAVQCSWLEGKFGKLQPDWYLFPFSSRVRPVDPTRPITTVKSAWEAVRKAAGVDCRFHDLRHTAITKLAERGVPDSTMKAIAGHVHEKMLERYSHVRMAAKREAVEALNLEKSVGVPAKVPTVAPKSRLKVVSK